MIQMDMQPELPSYIRYPPPMLTGDRNIPCTQRDTPNGRVTQTAERKEDGGLSQSPSLCPSNPMGTARVSYRYH